MRIIFDIKIKCQGINSKTNQFNKWFKTKYITIKRMRTKSHIKTKCKGMNLKNNNLINNLRPDTL
jgi:Tfp pilus assembly major pilin PilA